MALASHPVSERLARLSSAQVSSTTIQLCGPYLVEIDGRRVEQALPGRQGRLLFAYLVLNRDRPLGRAELIDAVWSDEPPRDPADALAALLSKVRATVGNRYLEGRSRLTLTLPPHAEVDVERAMTAVHQAESACSQTDSSWSHLHCMPQPGWLQWPGPGTTCCGPSPSASSSLVSLLWGPAFVPRWGCGDKRRTMPA